MAGLYHGVKVKHREKQGYRHWNQIIGSGRWDNLVMEPGSEYSKVSWTCKSVWFCFPGAMIIYVYNSKWTRYISLHSLQIHVLILTIFKCHYGICFHCHPWNHFPGTHQFLRRKTYPMHSFKCFPLLNQFVSWLDSKGEVRNMLDCLILWLLIVWRNSWMCSFECAVLNSTPLSLTKWEWDFVSMEMVMITPTD